jgi:sec-independent protein translocase protein TatB
MFDIGWSELLVIGIVALIAIGPKELPGVLRTVGNYMGKIRRMASEFQGQFHEAMREAEMADLKKSVDEMAESATKGFTDFDPIGSVRKEIDSLSADPLAESAKPETSKPEPSSTPESASPEAAAESMPAPVSADTAIPQPAMADTALAPEAPQPQPESKAETKAGSGA